MKRCIALLFFALPVFIASSSPGQSQEKPPAWAYPVNPPDFKRTPDDGSVRRVPDSTAGYTLTQVRDLFATPDWHPDEHPAMPKIVATGRKPEVTACGVCHRADGSGGPENSSLSGLSADYITRQTQEMRSGDRMPSTSRVPTDLMIKAAKGVTDQELAEASAYFASIKPRANIKVVESDTVPKTEVRELYLNALAGDEREPIGPRIIELADNLESFISRDSRVGFVAYVPTGSVEKGKKLATTSSDPNMVCATCHGEGLKGSDLAPRIAGRSPTYLFRQLYDFKSGMRHGADSASMKAVVETRSIDDMIALAAYAGSLAP